MSEPSADLQFDRAAFAKPGGQPCASCGGALGAEYWKWQQHIVCAACRDKVEATLAKSQSGSAFGKALLLGGGAAVACGIAYAIFVGVTKIQIAFATIGIAFVIARVVRKASGGVGGRRFQVLAVALTYVASAMGYFPPVWNGVRSAAEKHHTAAATASSAASGTLGDEASAPPAAEPAEEAKPSVLGFAVGIAFLIAVTLAAPFLEFTEAPIGLLIVLFGLWEAWKLSRGLPLKVEGPFRLAHPSTGPPVP